MPGATDADLNDRAAKNVRNLMPTYSMIPKAGKMLRRFPFTGTFISFPAEIIRNQYNTVALIKQEIKDPRTRGIAMQRMQGMFAAHTIPLAVGAATMHIVGVTDEEEKDIRRFLPPWSKNSTLGFTARERGDKPSIGYVDIGYSDPYALLHKPVMAAFMSDSDAMTQVLESSREFLAPFISEDLFTQKLLDVARNKKLGGGDVYKKTDPLGDKLWDSFLHIADAVEPGTWTSAQRIHQAVTGEVTRGGVKRNTKDEIVAVITGQRRSTLDITGALGWKYRDFAPSLRDAQAALNQTLHDPRNQTPKQIQDAHRNYQSFAGGIMEQIVADTSAARRLGLPDSVIESLLEESGIRSDIAAQIVDGDASVPPFVIPRRAKDIDSRESLIRSSLGDEAIKKERTTSSESLRPDRESLRPDRSGRLRR